MSGTCISLEKSAPHSQKGMSLVEVMIGTAIAGVVLVQLTQVLMVSSKTMRTIYNKSKSDVNVRRAVDRMETHILNANEFRVALANSVEFTADLITDPGYEADKITMHGVRRIEDPDDDGDANSIVPAVDRWRVGYDMQDDDDDGDMKIDMRWRYYIDSANYRLYEDYSKNEEPWGNHIEVICEKVVSQNVFSFSGAADKKIDPDAFEMNLPMMDLNSNGIITALEIDSLVDRLGHDNTFHPAALGDGNGLLDKPWELRRISLVRIHLEADEDKGRGKNGKHDSILEVDVMPPSLYLKKLQ